MASRLLTTFHAFFVVHNLFLIFRTSSLNYDQNDDPDIQKFKTYEWRFGTSWSVTMQLLYFTLQLLEDFISLKPKRFNRIWLTVKPYFFVSFVFPTALFVSTMFWTLYVINRELVYPLVMSSIMPDWLNHMAHTNPLFLVIAEALLIKHEKVNKRIALTLLLGFNLIYYTVYYLTYFQSGLWLYNVWSVFNWGQRVVFTIIAIYLSSLLMKICLILQQDNINLKFNKTTKVD